MNDGFVCRDIWASAALVYAGYEVTRIEISGFDATEWQFDAPSLDAQMIVDEYEAGKLMLADAKAYSLAFTRLNTQIKNMNARGETLWRCDAYWARVRESVEARRREREQREERERRRDHVGARR